MTTRSQQLSSLSLAIVLAIGAQTVWFVMAACVGGPVFEWWFPSEPSPELIILRDGTPVISTRATDDEDSVVRTLEGKRLKVRISWEHQASTSNLPALPREEKQFQPLAWSQRLVRIFGRSDKSSHVVWYFVHDGTLNGRGYFMSYDTKTNRNIGYLGRHGFRPDKPPTEEQFPVGGQKLRGGPKAFLSNGYYEVLEDSEFSSAIVEDSGRSYMLPPWTSFLLSDDALVAVNLKEGTVKCLRKGTDIISAVMALKDPTAPKTPLRAMMPSQTILIRTPDRVFVTDLNGKELRTYLLPAELRSVELAWLQLSDGNVLVRPGHDYCIWNNELFWLAPNGHILRHEKVDLGTSSRQSESMVAAAISLVVPSFGLVAGFVACTTWLAAPQAASLGYLAALAQASARVWPTLLITGAIGIVLACLCYYRQRKYGLPWTAAWTVFVLLFGLPAYVGYMTHRLWPARLACPSCGRLVSRDREACFACGREFPAPPPKGIEVFA